jgi:hypothetical protein
LQESDDPSIRVIRWKESILDDIREHPARVVGRKSLTALRFFLQGYEWRQIRTGDLGPSEVPIRFADCVGYRLHLESNWSGFWDRQILSRFRDEALAFDRFYELFDEFNAREAKVVATIREDRRQGLPRSLRIVVFTEDPGFFLDADEDEGFFYRGWFFCAIDHWEDGSFVDRLVVKDESTWSRLLEENKRYKRNLKRRRARIASKKAKFAREAKADPLRG